MSGGKGMRCVVYMGGVYMGGVYMGGVYMGVCVHEGKMRV